MRLLAFGALVIGMAVAAGAAGETVIDFEKDKAGSPPQGFETALTGSGKPGAWVVVEDDKATSGHLVLAQTDADSTSYRFPVCILQSVTTRDADISVKTKAVSGRVDQGAGIVWRYRDKDNYYIVRANALEGNVVLYKVENGKRTDLPLKGEGRTYGKKASVPSGVWNTLAVNVKGSNFEVLFNGAKLYEVEDTTFPDAGKIGLWTKADSVMRFDDLRIVTH
jgi:hypothetical protein